MDGCTCQRCGANYQVDFLLTDGLWRFVSDGENLLCGYCIVKSLESLGFGAFDITETK